MPIQVLPNCQASEKLDEWARRYFRMYVRTHARTYGRDSLGLQRLHRETNKRLRRETKN